MRPQAGHRGRAGAAFWSERSLLESSLLPGGRLPPRPLADCSSLIRFTDGHLLHSDSGRLHPPSFSQKRLQSITFDRILASWPIRSTRTITHLSPSVSLSFCDPPDAYVGTLDRLQRVSETLSVFLHSFFSPVPQFDNRN